MSPDKPQNLLIKVEGIEETDKQIKIKGNGKKFSFWKTKQDGTDTQAHAAFLAEDIKTGDTLQISFVVEGFTLKDGTPAKSNKVIWLKKTHPGEVGNLIGIPLSSQEDVSSSEKTPEFWDKKAYKQCLWNYWLEHPWEMANVAITAAEFEKVWVAFKLIEADADKRFAKGWEKAKATFSDGSPLPDELPVIHIDQEEEVDVDDIPF